MYQYLIPLFLFSTPYFGVGGEKERGIDEIDELMKTCKKTSDCMAGG